jgi:hypothetical protein
MWISLKSKVQWWLPETRERRMEGRMRKCWSKVTKLQLSRRENFVGFIVRDRITIKIKHYIFFKDRANILECFHHRKCLK